MGTRKWLGHSGCRDESSEGAGLTEAAWELTLDPRAQGWAGLAQGPAESAATGLRIPEFSGSMLLGDSSAECRPS